MPKWSNSRNGNLRFSVNRENQSGIFIGPTLGLSSPKNSRRACLCLNSNTYDVKCFQGYLMNQSNLYQMLHHHLHLYYPVLLYPNHLIQTAHQNHLPNLRPRLRYHRIHHLLQLKRIPKSFVHLQLHYQIHHLYHHFQQLQDILYRFVLNNFLIIIHLLHHHRLILCSLLHHLQLKDILHLVMMLNCQTHN